jgi:exosome complex component RRP4
MKGRGLEVLEGGMVLEVSPAKIPRIIGRRGSMINMINDHLRIDSVVGQNGRIWIKTSDVEKLRLAIKAFKMIEDQAHTSNLTDRINRMLTEEVAKLSGSKPSEEPSDKVETIDKEEQVSDLEPEDEASEEIEEPVEEVIELEASTDVENESDDKTETEEVKE